MKSIRSHQIAFLLAPALVVASESIPLEGTFGAGAGFGVQRYQGTLGDQGSFYGRLKAVHHPTEWLSAQLVYGFGNIGNGDSKPEFTTETFSHLGLDLALQPQLGLGSWRPYVASGLATTFGTAFQDGRNVANLDFNLYVPVGLGCEYILDRNWSLWAGLETYLVMADGDLLDGDPRGEGYLESRDELQKLVVGATFRFDIPRSQGNSPQPPRTAVALAGDRDGDGIKDQLDRCSNTPAATLVDVQGCPSDWDRDGVPDLLDDCPSTPIGNRVDETGCSLANDKDHDGIPDAADRCPNTARNATVDATGCPVAQAKAKPVVDSDKDGIPDSQDQCPGTPKGEPVDAAGCPPTPVAPPPPEPEPIEDIPQAVPPPPQTPHDPSPESIPAAAVVAPPPPATLPDPPAPAPVKPKAIATAKPEKDSDKDGVPDSRDRCRSTSLGSRVDSTGCAAPADPEADSDKDGVRDIGDQCPHSKYGMKVDATGCQILTLEKGSQTILEGVQFQPGTARLLEGSLPVLEHLARILKKNPARVEIAGFTERQGPEGENLSLSQRRAEVVKEHLVTIGAESSRLSVRGYGSAEPIADNKVEAGRLRNRRIELRVR